MWREMPLTGVCKPPRFAALTLQSNWSYRASTYSTASTDLQYTACQNGSLYRHRMDRAVASLIDQCCYSDSVTK
jgi:hypothetical protein